MRSPEREAYGLRVVEVLNLLRTQHADWTDSTIGERLRITKSAVSQWRKFQVLPNPQTMFALADLAGIAPRWLAVGTGPQMADQSRDELPEQVLALARKIAKLSPAGLEAMRATFGTESVPDKRVEDAFPRPPAAKSTKKHR